MYLLIKYIKSVLWRVAKCLSYIEEARCLKVNRIPLYLSVSFVHSHLQQMDSNLDHQQHTIANKNDRMDYGI